MRRASLKIITPLLLSLFLLLPLLSPESIVSSSETIEIVRNSWGIPHVYALSSESAFFGLGYVTAQDRMFQMEYSRRIVKGTISELIGEKGLESDKLWRIIGWYRNAQETAEKLDLKAKQLLQAYSAGVNHYLKTENQLYLFTQYQVIPEEWTIADSIACWYRISYFFNGIDSGEVTNLYSFEELITQVGFEEATKQLFAAPIIDETGAIIQEKDVSPELLAELRQYLSNYGYNDTRTFEQSKDPPKASHAWVIGGNRTTTGSAILHSDPQLLVNAPSIWYEFHICGGEFDARGIGVAGAPIMLIGWNRNIAWGATAAKSDTVDLYKLSINPQNTNEYWYDGQYRTIQVYNEVIRLKNGNTVPIKYRKTVVGPVVTSLLPGSRSGNEYAMKHSEVYNSSVCSLEAGINLMKANDYESFRSAIENYQSPSIHMIYGDKSGNIAYQLLSGIPLRSSAFPFFGSVAQPGNSSDYDWKEIIPKKYLPHTYNPQNGAISTANNMAAGSWYPLSTNFGTGDTIRSWRLRELISSQSEFSQEDILRIHQDTINPAIRELVRLARHIAYNLNQTLSSEAERALNALQTWNGEYNTSQPSYPLISNFNLMFRSSNTPLALTYGGGEGGLCKFAKKVSQNLNTNQYYEPTEDEVEYVNSLLKSAWTNTVTSFGNDPTKWLEKYDTSIQVKFQNNIENFGSLDFRGEFTSPPLMCKHTATILSQHGNSYSQNIRFDNIDLSQSILPPGISENPENPLFKNQIDLWAEGKLHPAPISKELIMEEATSKISLSYPPKPTAPTNSQTPSPTSPTFEPMPIQTETPEPITQPPVKPSQLPEELKPLSFSTIACAIIFIIVISTIVLILSKRRRNSLIKNMYGGMT